MILPTGRTFGMDGDNGRQFGIPSAGIASTDRPGAYGIIILGDRVLIVATPAGLYLPGGGIGPGEAAEAALRREVCEETGYEVVTTVALGAARQYVGSGINKIETFFLVSIAGKIVQNESDHRPLWLAVDEAIAGMAEEAQGWALRRARAIAQGLDFAPEVGPTV